MTEITLKRERERGGGERAIPIWAEYTQFWSVFVQPLILPKHHLMSAR